MSGMRKPTLTILVALACVVTLYDIAAAQKSELKFRVPAGWVEEERTSNMRVAEYRLPKAPGDTEDASLVLITLDRDKAVRLRRTSIAGSAR